MSLDWLSGIDGVQFNGTFTINVIFIRHAATIHFYREGKEITMLTMTDTQMADVSLVIKDKNGNPATVDGVPVWTTSNVNVAEAIVTDPTGMLGSVQGRGSGVCQITVTADADLGSGVKPIIGFLDVTILGQATVIELIPGVPTEMP